MNDEHSKADEHDANPNNSSSKIETDKQNTARLLGEVKRVSPAVSDDEADREMSRRTRRGFLVGGAAAIAGYVGYRYLWSASDAGGIPSPLRRAHEFNEKLSTAYFDGSRLAHTFPREQSSMPRVNGGFGMENDFDPAMWRLQVKSSTNKDALSLTLDDIKSLPKVEMTTELRCIEGWSDTGHWGGARFSDFADLYGRGTSSRYVSVETPGGGYYVGLDIESALHPQTLLCYEMQGQPLTPEHGAPLRLYLPVKYGIKSLKRIGTIAFTDERPRDYWAERGYDWYSGH